MAAADVDEMYDLLAFYGQAVPTADQVDARHVSDIKYAVKTGFENGNDHVYAYSAHCAQACTCDPGEEQPARHVDCYFCLPAQIKHDDMCEAVQRFSEQLAAAGVFLQEAWEAQAAQLNTAVHTAPC